MNPGPVEDVGKVATSIVESLKSSPATLALIAFFSIFLVLFYMSIRDQRVSMEKVQSTLIAQIGKMSEMLYNCAPTVPPK